MLGRERVEGSLSQGALHAGNVVNVVSDLSQDGQVSCLTGHTLEADVGLQSEEVTAYYHLLSITS